MNTTTHLLYLHGFRSSPHSTKAQIVAAWLRQRHPGVHWWCPQLPPSPRAAADLIHAGTCEWPRTTMAIIGSSLGGFYATWLAERRNCRAVVLNPAVAAARDLAGQVGELTAWHDAAQRFDFRSEYIAELRALEVAHITRPERYFALIAKGDEVLDWREMTAHFRGAHIDLLEGGDHALSGFGQHLPAIAGFLGLAP